MAKKSLRLVVNGKVAGNEALRAAVREVRKKGHFVEVLVTWEGGDAHRFALESDRAEVLVAAGGDGTVNEVVHGLMNRPPTARAALAVIPLGTANDFATGCGVPRDPAEALALSVIGPSIPVDVGKANDDWFINAASCGFGAIVTAATPPELKRLLGGAAYTLMAAILATNFRPYEGRLLLPDREITGADVVAIVGNGRQTGGGKQVAPRAFLDDGLLDILVVRDIPASKLPNAVRELRLLSPNGEFISYFQVPWAEFHAARAVPVNLDGEPTQFTSVRYEAVPGALPLIVPSGCPMVRSSLMKLVTVSSTRSGL
jgi:lipid kinase YegS